MIPGTHKIRRLEESALTTWYLGFFWLDLPCFLSCVYSYVVPIADSNDHLRLKNKIHSKAFDDAIPGWLQQFASSSKGKKWDRMAHCCLMGCILNNLRNRQNLQFDEHVLGPKTSLYMTWLPEHFSECTLEQLGYIPAGIYIYILYILYTYPSISQYHHRNSWFTELKDDDFPQQ